MKLKFAALLATFSFSVPVFADMPSINPRPRMLGMGGAGAAISGSTDSAMMNPAALNDIEKSKFEVLPLLMEVPFDIGIVSDYFDFDSAIEEADALADENAKEAAKRAAFEDFIDGITSMATATRVNFYPSWTKKNLHIGLLADFLVNPRFRAGGVTSNQVIELGGSSGTAGLIVGGSYAFLQNRLKVGATLKPLYRVALTVAQEQTAYDFLNGSDTDMSDVIFGEDVAGRRGFGFGVDLGVRYDLPWLEEFRPAVALTYQDIANTRFFGDNKPSSIEQSLSLGLAFHPDWKFLKNTIALDLRNINEKQEFMNKLHFGFETLIWELIAIRGGFGQGYFSAGVGLMTRLFEMDFFLSSQEAGKKAHIQAQRTLGLKLSLGF